MRMIDDCRYHLVKAGISMPDSDALRRISMTLHRWHELERGDGNDHGSWSIERDDNGDGPPYLVRHHYHWTRDGTTGQQVNHATTSRTRIPNREMGARKRLAKIMARYPGFTAYVQGDPRGAALYILRPGDVPEGEQADAYYSRGIVVCK